MAAASRSKQSADGGQGRFFIDGLIGIQNDVCLTCPLGVLGSPRYWPKQTSEPSSNEMKIRPRATIIPSKTGEDSSLY